MFPLSEQPEAIRIDRALGIVHIHGGLVKAAVQATIGASDGKWCMRDVLQVTDWPCCHWWWCSEVV